MAFHSMACICKKPLYHVACKIMPLTHHYASTTFNVAAANFSTLNGLIM